MTQEQHKAPSSLIELANELASQTGLSHAQINEILERTSSLYHQFPASIGQILYRTGAAINIREVKP